MQSQGEVEAVQLMLPSGPVTISTQDMTAIRSALRAALLARSQENPTDYSPLVAELDAVEAWSVRGGGHIGAWELATRKMQLVLVRQPQPAPARLFYVAFLERQDGHRWRVTTVDVEAVHAR